ncbi:MAG: hypothetical protein U0V72_04320 [Cytophagales bacterium]
MKTNNLILYCILIMLSACCHKGCYKSGGECKERCLKKGPAIPDSVLNDFSFKNGSYWIYRDSISGSFDTVMVSNYQINYANNNGFGWDCNLYHTLSYDLIGLSEESKQQVLIENINPVKVYFNYWNYLELNYNGKYYSENANKIDTTIIIDKKKYEVFRLQTWEEFKYNTIALYFGKKIGIIQYDFYDISNKKIKKYELFKHQIL